MEKNTEEKNLLNPGRDSSEGLLERIGALNVKGEHQYVGDYRVLRTLGKGSFGVVKLCVAPDGMEVAVKVLTDGELARCPPEQRNRVETEIKTLQSLHHPFICSLLAVQHSPPHKLIVMEYLRNGELYDLLLKEGELDADDVFRYYAEAHCAALHLHNKGVYHRDIKLENLLLDSAGVVKLCDFGFCWKSTMQGEKVATVCGSPHYAAPEVLRGVSHVPELAEVWSLGVVLFALTTSTLPFDGPTLDVARSRSLAGAYKCPLGTPSSLEDFFTCVFKVDPRSRITLHGICKHPWYASRYPRLPVSVKQAIEKETS